MSALPNGASSRRYRIHVAATMVVLAAAIYLSSGTMAPYAVTAEYPTILHPCHYLVNVDHQQFEAVFRMVAGEEPARWAGSVVLRRILFPVLAYPFARILGILAGGLLASIIIHVAVMAAFAAFIRREVGERAAIASLWLIATYPGITYWAGLPYSYVLIVPGSLLCLMLLYRLDAARSVGEAARAMFLMGIIFTGYDLFPFFATAALLLLAARRRWRLLFPSFLAMAIPSALVALMFVLMQVALLNSNTGSYLTIAFSYFNAAAYSAKWLRLLAELPLILVSNFVFSNMVFLPLLFIAAVALARRLRIAVFRLPETAVLVSALLVFTFSNAAPPYYGWQLRGYWVARLYQPIVVVLLIVIARMVEAAGPASRPLQLAVAFTVLANASIAFGPVLLNPLAGWVYARFYVHSPPRSMITNLERFGRRPLGFCSGSHAWDHIVNPNTPWNRPSFMYVYAPRRK